MDMRQAILGLCWTITASCAILTIYPYVIYPLLLRLMPRRPTLTANRRSNRGREFALLFCAYNESSALSWKIDNVRELQIQYPELEVLAYDDCSSDGTADLIEQAGHGIRLVRGTERAGKAHGMKLLVSMTERDYLIFTDANVELNLEALDQLCSAYADEMVGGVCGMLQYSDNDGTPVSHAGGLYWRLEEFTKAQESRSGNVMGADGSIFSIRRRLYPDFPDTVLDDLTVSMAVI
mgnify:CR=1 FL=1